MEHRIISKEYREKPKGNNNLILHFNYLLDKKSNYFSLNESALEDLIKQLDNLIFVRDLSYWLTMARINELALLCTENYANNGEIILVGDLLFNPRHILIHVRGRNRPIVKKRHTPLTEQFGFVAETFPEVVKWLKTETSLEIKTPALLPYLHQELEESGCFSKEYDNSLNERKTQIAELTVFLSSARVTDSLALYQWLKSADPTARALMESKLCCCNLDRFLELGRQVRDFAQGPAIPTRFQDWEFSGNKEFFADQNRSRDSIRVLGLTPIG